MAKVKFPTLLMTLLMSGGISILTLLGTPSYAIDGLNSGSSDLTRLMRDLESLASDSGLVNEISQSSILISTSLISTTLISTAGTHAVDKPVSSNDLKSTASSTTTSSGMTYRQPAENKPAQVIVVSPDKAVTEKKSAETPAGPVANSKEYWKILHALESSSGKRIYKRSNRARSCKWTKSPCGHHQLSYIALKEIGCTSLKCRKAREDFQQSLKMSKKLQAINKTRLKRLGHTNLPDYQTYLAHQQGVSGISRILHAAKGKKKLTRRIIRFMAANSPFSKRHLKRLGSRKAARKFLAFWEKRWNQKNARLIASQ